MQLLADDTTADLQKRTRTIERGTGPVRRSRFMEFRHRFLEDDFPRQLHLTGTVDRRGDHTKVLAILAVIRDTPNRMVEGIERVEPQLQVY